jgi:hypothetical protein
MRPSGIGRQILTAGRILIPRGSAVPQQRSGLDRHSVRWAYRFPPSRAGEERGWRSANRWPLVKRLVARRAFRVAPTQQPQPLDRLLPVPRATSAAPAAATPVRRFAGAGPHGPVANDLTGGRSIAGWPPTPLQRSVRVRAVAVRNDLTGQDPIRRPAAYARRKSRRRPLQRSVRVRAIALPGRPAALTNGRSFEQRPAV